MNSLKAIAAGIFFVIVATLVLQLVFIMVAVGYNNLAIYYDFLNNIATVLKYVVIFPVIFGVMFLGGYITANLSDSHTMIHCAVVGLISSTGFLWLALENAELSIVGIVLVIVMFIATLLGGIYSKREIPNEKILSI